MKGMISILNTSATRFFLDQQLREQFELSFRRIRVKGIFIVGSCYHWGRLNIRGIVHSVLKFEFLEADLSKDFGECCLDEPLKVWTVDWTT
jgi:hypothetical protein